MAPVRGRLHSAVASNAIVGGGKGLRRLLLVMSVVLSGLYMGFMLGSPSPTTFNSHDTRGLRKFLELAHQQAAHNLSLSEASSFKGPSSSLLPVVDTASLADASGEQQQQPSDNEEAARSSAMRGDQEASGGSAAGGGSGSDEDEEATGATPTGSTDIASTSSAETSPEAPSSVSQQQEVVNEEEEEAMHDGGSAGTGEVGSTIGGGGGGGGVKGLDVGVLECPVTGHGPYKGGVVYWKDWTDEAPVWEPLYPHAEQGETYVTFEPDEGGFNNVRMSMEVIIVFAFITGRTLVMPDEYPMYLLGQKGLLHDFADFFDLTKASRHVRMIQMKDFLAREALTGQLRDGLLPPGNHTTFFKKRLLWRYIRSVSTTFAYSPNAYVLGFDVEQDEERFQEMKGATRQLATYDAELQGEKVIHFTSQFEGGIRWLTHFYGYFFFGDRARDNHVKRFVRDFLHYKDDIFCAAARIVELIEAEAGPSSYTAIHIRRGDFQFKETRLPIETIFANVDDLVEPGSLVYVLTDERNATFFYPVRERYRLRFLHDYWDAAELGHEANPNHSGMIEQVIASGARRFIGTYFSTLTAYVTRLRGYRGVEPGYYFMPEKKHALMDGSETYARSPFFHREWKAAYEGIDDV